ncbi:MAG: serine/threonine protein kinase [Pirellulaceae bacterium]|nr:serine/threonine protein kinase [Pirellulaceae bacterium]
MESGLILGERYQIVREIGRGSFGIVYLVDDLHTTEPRAIKVLLPWAARNSELRHRLRREARLAGGLVGPHAVRIYEASETDAGDVYIVMEYLQGEELSELLARVRTLSPERVETIARQVLAALDEAHRAGIIHRDLKPHNIYLCATEDGREHVKVFDFGIAKVTGDGNLLATAKLTVSGGVMGTPAYMSPEQCRGEELTLAADFYSLGIVLYEALTGQVPFDDENPVRILLMHNQDPVPPLPPDLAATPLGRAVIRSLAKDPRQRFAAAADFLAALDGLEVPLPAASSAPTKTSTLTADGNSAADGEESANAPASMTIALVIGGIVAVGIVVATIVYFALQ